MDIAIDRVTDLVIRLRAVEVKEGMTDPASGSNPIDDGSVDILVSGTDYATEDELRSMIDGLNDDERADLLALFYVGRDDMEPEEWRDAVRFAREREAAGEGAATTILRTPIASELLEEGLASLGITPDLSDA
ncbi:DUF3775 domain-containing protein [Methylorubrum extorquens]